MASSEFTRVLVGWDGSTGASAGLRIALRLTAAEGSRVTALAVVPGLGHVEDAEKREQAISEVRTPLQAAYDSVIDETDLAPGQQASLEFVEAADIAKALNRYTAMHPIGLVVVGLHGREGLLHPRMGHIASQAVRAGRCPVLVVPEPGIPAAYPSEDDAASSRLFHPFRRHHEPSS